MGNLFSNLWKSSKLESVRVIYDGKTHRIAFAASDYDSDKHVRVSTLIRLAAQELQIPESELALSVKSTQRKLSEPKKTLESYGVANKTEVAAQKVVSAPKVVIPKLQPKEEISKVLEEVETELGARIDAFIQAPPADKEARAEEHRILSEVILAKTIALDNVQIASEDDRATRKRAIAKLQQFHHELDRTNNGQSVKEHVQDEARREAELTQQEGAGESKEANEAQPADDVKPHVKEETNQSPETPHKPTETVNKQDFSVSESEQTKATSQPDSAVPEPRQAKETGDEPRVKAMQAEEPKSDGAEEAESSLPEQVTQVEQSANETPVEVDTAEPSEPVSEQLETPKIAAEGESDNTAKIVPTEIASTPKKLNTQPIKSETAPTEMPVVTASVETVTSEVDDAEAALSGKKEPAEGEAAEGEAVETESAQTESAQTEKEEKEEKEAPEVETAPASPDAAPAASTPKLKPRNKKKNKKKGRK